MDEKDFHWRLAALLNSRTAMTRLICHCAQKSKLQTRWCKSGNWRLVYPWFRGTNRPGERGVWDRIEREQGAVIRIGREHVAPFHPQIAQLSFKSFFGTVQRANAPASRFKMLQLGVRCEYDALADRAQLQTIIDVVEIYREFLVSSIPPTSKKSSRRVSMQAAVTALHSCATRSTSV